MLNLRKRFADRPINKILTIEASGIGIACVVAQHFGVPVVFAKKQKKALISKARCIRQKSSHLPTNAKNQVIVAKKFLSEDDHVLIIDDFSGKWLCTSGIDPDRESCRRNCRGNRNRD